MTEQPSAAAEQAQADADLTHALQEEQLTSDLAADEQADAAVAADEAALDPSSSDSSTSSELAASAGEPSSAPSAETSTDNSNALAPSDIPEPPAEEQGAAPEAGETAEEPNVGEAVAAEAPVTHGLDDGDTSGGAGQYPTDPTANAPTAVVTPGTEGDEVPAAAPYDPTGGANAGASIAPSQGDVPQSEPQPTNEDGSAIPTPDA